MDMIKPVLVWSLLVKGSAPQGRVLCSIQYEECDLKYFINMPYGTDIHEVFLPQNPRFKEAYRHLPRSWHPDLNVRQQELAAMHAGTPKDCLFPWNEKLLHMIEEVTVTFHVNESNQGVLATLVLTNFRLWFVPYRKVKGLLHEDVHTIAIGKILKASISQQKRGSNVNTVTVLELENMDAGHYHVTLSPISRLRHSVRDYSRDAEAKRIKQLHNLVAEIEWLKIENTFCASYDLNHLVLDGKDEQTGGDIAHFYERMDASSGGIVKPPPSLTRASTTQCNPNDHANIVNMFVKPAEADQPATAPPQRAPQLQHHVSELTLQVSERDTPKPTPGGHHMTARRRIRYDVEAEFRRQGATDHPRWRMCKANLMYDLCPSYPALMMVPAGLPDDVIKEAAKFRSKNRFPALTWVHPRTGAPLCRCSQPNTGVLRSNNLNDRDLIWAIRDAAIPAEAAWRSSQAQPKKSSVLHIVDARPEINAKGNALAGKGHESVKQYDRDGIPTASITFMGIDNIHAVRSAFAGLTEALYEVEDSNFFGAVQKSHWLEYVCGILQGASEVAMHLERGDAVLVHCSDGWDRTAQLTSLSQLMLDPYFRTLEGFATLVEKDWCSFGHMFKKRCGHPTSDQTSPIFQQFLDAVYQLTLQFPTHFQFNELFLSSVADAVYSSWYGTFQMNSERERMTFLLNVPSVSVWDVIRASTDQYLNPLFNGGDGYGEGSGGIRLEAMLPVCRVRVMQLWCSQYQKAISHMRLQQREYEMLQLIRQQETELSRVHAVISSSQRMELRAIQLRADIASLARSMNLEYPDEAARNSDGGGGRSSTGGGTGVPQSAPSQTAHVGKRAPAVSVDFHDLTSVAQAQNASDASLRPSIENSSNAVSPASSAASTDRRKSISRSRSNSVRLKNSILNMIGAVSGSSNDKPTPQPDAASTAHHHANVRHQHDKLKKELQSLESQITKLNNQVSRKEDSAKLMMRRFRCYNYNLPESALAEPESTASPSHGGKQSFHRSSLRHRASFGRSGDRYNSPSAFSPSSSSSRGSPSPSARRNTQPGSSSDDSERHFNPGSAPLLTTNKVITSSFRNPQPAWERDVDAPCCKRCKKKFKTFYRNRHHCRCCGFVFCGKCTNSRMNLPEFGYYDVVRVCLTCYNNGDDG